MNIAVVLAGGVGARIGAGIPKQFIKVLDKPIMIYTLETFEKSTCIDKIVLVCVSSHIDIAKKYCEEYKISKIIDYVEGGEEFVDSCINGMNSLYGECKSDDIVLITSADRPFISEEEIQDSIRVCKEHGCGIAARRCSLCMFKAEQGVEHSSEYLRNELLQTATPWTFEYGKLKEALDLYQKNELPSCETYPIAIYAAAGNEVYFSLSKPENIKITQKYDVALMEQLLISRKD